MDTSVLGTSVINPSAAPRFDEMIFEAMGTTVHVIVAADARRGPRGAELLTVARSAIEESERRLSRFLSDSEVSLVNAAAGNPVRVSIATLDLVTTAMRAFDETGGAFDPLLGRAIEREGYDRDFTRLHAPRPAAAPLDQHSFDQHSLDLSSDEHQRLRIDSVAATIEVAPGHALDLGGIAKGATADAVAAELLALGALGCCVSIGGDVRVRGIGPEQGAWRVDLACPGAYANGQKRSITLSEGAVCTSSTTKRRWQRCDDGSESHHLLDPSTGRSRRNGPTTVTIVAATATAAEIVTKWVFAGGSADVFDTTGIVVDRFGRVMELPGFAAFSADGNALCASRAPRAGTAEANGAG